MVVLQRYRPVEHAADILLIEFLLKLDKICGQLLVKLLLLRLRFVICLQRFGFVRFEVAYVAVCLRKLR